MLTQIYRKVKKGKGNCANINKHKRPALVGGKLLYTQAHKIPPINVKQTTQKPPAIKVYFHDLLS